MLDIELLVDVMRQEQETLQQKHSNAILQKLDDLAKIAPTIGLRNVLIIGYTPSFNDGDPCYHRTNIIMDQNEIEDYLGDEDSEDINLIENNLSEVHGEELYYFFEIFDEFYLVPVHTDYYKVIISFYDDGTYNMEKSDYYGDY